MGVGWLDVHGQREANFKALCSRVLRFRERGEGGGHARGNAFEAHGVDASSSEAETAGSVRRDLGGRGWQFQALGDPDRAGFWCLNPKP
jgi:hypothetical protein